eukprot:1130828_1
MGNKHSHKSLNHVNEANQSPEELFRKEKLIDEYKKKFPKQHNQESTLTADELAVWLSNYLLTEEYHNVNDIKTDLNDPYSHLKQQMSHDLTSKKSLNPQSVHELYTFLRDDVFNAEEETDSPMTTTPSASKTPIIAAPVLAQKESHPLSDIFEPQTSPLTLDTYANLQQTSLTHSPAKLTSPPQLNNLSIDSFRPSVNSYHITASASLNESQSYTLRSNPGGPPGLKRMPTTHEEVIEDEYTSNKEPFPQFINVALFGRSDDEFLEQLIDKAILKVCNLQTLWSDREFIEEIYDDNAFAQAVYKVFDLIDADGHEDLEFIGSFVAQQFKRQINEHKRSIEEKTSITHDDEEKYEVSSYVVKMCGDEYRIQRADRTHTHNQLFELKVKEEDYKEFCWSVFKKKNIRNLCDIEVDGYWEIIEKEKDEERRIELDKERREQLPPLGRTSGSVSNGLSSIATSMVNIFARKLTRSDRKSNRMNVLEGVTMSGSDVDLDTDNELLRLNTTQLTQEKQQQTCVIKKKKKKFKYIPLLHLNIIFELLQHHYWHSVKDEKEKDAILNKDPELIDTPLYRDYCIDEKKKSKRKLRREYRIRIEHELYRLSWWNAKGRASCNAIAIYVGETPTDGTRDREYYYMRFKYKIKKMIWDWYDNDVCKYKKYYPGHNHCVYKELEAAFQSNVESNFPQYHFNPMRADELLPSPSSESLSTSIFTRQDSHMFDVCLLPQLQKYLKENFNIQSNAMMIRFMFTESKHRIANMEQISLRYQHEPYSRNIRRLVNKQNSLQTYWQHTNEFIEEWKRRYLLASKQQQLYFWSHILAISSIMKYIEIEFQHQMISLPYQTVKNDNDEAFKGLDDSDIQRHKIDYQLWQGFFVPPMNQLQTASISKNMLQEVDDLENWHQSISRVESLQKFIYRESESNKFVYRHTTAPRMECKHKCKIGDALWLCKTTYDVYCNKCAVLLQFSECIRKYVLETESHEVIDFLWPWYRNYFHRGDSTKYHKYICKYNLSRLFVTQDVLPEKDYDQKEVDQQELKRFLKHIHQSKYYKSMQQYGIDDLDELSMFNEGDLERKLDIDNASHRAEILSELDKLNNTEKPIRHLRKFAGSVLLGPWDILRNLNIIRNQLQSLFKFIEDIDDDNGLSEEQQLMSFALLSMLKADANEIETENGIMDKFKEYYDAFKRLNDNKTSDTSTETEEKTWHEWKEMINQCNGDLREQLEISNREKLLDLMLESSFDFTDDQKKIVSSLLSCILTHHENEAELERLHTEHEDGRFFTEFNRSWHKTPKWWTHNHDLLLLELSLKYNWDKDHINKELTDPSKKLYYQQLLQKQTAKMCTDVGKFREQRTLTADCWVIDEEDDDEDIKYENEFKPKDAINFECRGYQEFQVWCNDWRNIQHRLRMLSFIICKHLNECNPSIIAIRIPNVSDRLPQYDINSSVFLNGYIKRVHLENCVQKRRDLVDVNVRNERIRDIAQKKDVYHPTELRRARNSGLISLHEVALTQIFNRDPFMSRDVDFELEQICQSFDLLEYGVEMGFVLIKLLARKQVESLWSALGIVLEYMPYEKARFVLNEKREDLRHGEPQHLKNVCDRIRKGSNFSVHICLFLAEYMELNAKQDLARFDKWMEFSTYYEAEAGHTINEIESDHLLSVLMDIPLSESGKEKVSLLQVALEHNRAKFLNNERINAVLKHVWQTPSGLDPTVSIQRKQRTSHEILTLLLNQPYHFYLTPMGFNSTIKSLHLLYVLLVYIFMSQRIYLDDALGVFEWFLWSLNLGYFVYELIEAYDKGLRDYFTLAGWINYWDLQISFTWIILFAIRMFPLLFFAYHKSPMMEDGEWSWMIHQLYMVLWALQAASLSARSLVLFQTSRYFGVLLRMIQRLIVEMGRFLFVLILLLVGFVFGLYYIQGGYDEAHTTSVQDWYFGFRYLFQLTVGAGDFSEINDLVEDQITAQIFTILYIVLSTILMMNLLIALMTNTFENVHSQARTESSFAIAEATFDLSHRSRFMPAPICIYVLVLAYIIHILNILPAMVCPQYLNIYNCVNHHQYNWLVHFKCSLRGWATTCCNACARSKQRCCACCSKGTEALPGVELKINLKKDVYKLTTRGRVWKYYASTCFCCDCCTPKCIQKSLSKERFEMHHNGCYSCIPTELGAKDKDKDRSTCHGITLNEYAEKYEDHFKFSLDPQDTVLLKHLTVDTLFCKYCYRPFDPKNKYNLRDVLLTPFWALSEIISIYVFPLTVWIPLLIVYALLTLFEMIGNLLNDEESEAPNVPDYDRQYFQKDTLHWEFNNNNDKGSDD